MVELKLAIAFSLLLSFFAGISFTLETVRCSQQYNDSYYTFFAGCMINYNSGYIPEELYKKSFEQNMNLNLK